MRRKLSPKQKQQWNQFLAYQAVWVFLANLFLLIRHYGQVDSPFYEIGTQKLDLKTMTLVVTLIGIGIGKGHYLIDYWFEKRLFRRKRYWQIVGLKTVFQTVLFFVAITFGMIVIHFFTHMVTYPTLADQFKVFFGSKEVLVLFLYYLICSVLVNFMWQMSRKFGPGVMSKLFFGKYHQPRTEKRIFIFIDLKDSTVYAERLGHIKYSKLVQDCFRDLSEAVYYHKAEIYQYVGDEAVLTWEIESGLEDCNCIEVFYSFNKVLKSYEDRYIRRYGFVPEFKAGLNIGNVTVAEVGEVKREIAYHGDVLNTASRIQHKCNELGAKILITEELHDVLGSKNHKYKIEHKGSTELKGKDKFVNIYSVDIHELSVA